MRWLFGLADHWTSIRGIALILFSLFSTAGMCAELSVMGMHTGQSLSLDARMALCSDARELRSKLSSGDVHLIKVQCKSGAETLTVKLDGAEQIYGIVLRKDYEAGISMQLIEQLRSAQVDKYGTPDIETHKEPEMLIGEVWQYGWGESCFIDEETGRIAAAEEGGPCLVIDTDLTASKKLLVEYLEVTDMRLAPGYRSSKETELELYSKEKGARMLDFSDASKAEPENKN